MIYFTLISLIVILPHISQCIKRSKNYRRDKTVLLLSLLLIFLVLALKSPSVGRDISGYKRIYESMAYASWNDFDVCYFEWGYELLMMIFFHVFHSSFQFFMFCNYLFLFISYYLFISRYSYDFTFSILIYFCFTFFVFDTSAVRNFIAIGICLYSVPYIYKNDLFSFIKFLTLVFIASQIHSSAYIFFLVFMIIKTKITWKTCWLYIVIPIVIFILRSQIYSFIYIYLKPVNEGNIDIGGNIIFLIANVICGILFLYIKYKDDKFVGFSDKDEKLADFIRILYAAILIHLFTSGTSLSRLASYLQIFIILLLPNCISMLKIKQAVAFKLIVYVFLIFYFYQFAYVPNSLDILPYSFFWNGL